MIAMRDDIQRAMQRGEVTIAVLADFSKAFDTVSYPTVLRKLHSQSFSKNYLSGGSPATLREDSNLSR